MDYDKQQLVLHSPFNISTHKETFVNYLEVVMSPEGIVEYAVPSHQEKLISVLQNAEDGRGKRCTVIALKSIILT